MSLNMQNNLRSASTFVQARKVRKVPVSKVVCISDFQRERAICRPCSK